MLNTNLIQQRCGGVEVEYLIVGAGVIGLAIAREIAMKGHEVVIVEQQDCFGSGISSRNSEVIHAGLYYTPGSLKAKLCMEGRDLLYHYCESRNVRHSQVGKIIFAKTPAQSSELARIHANAKACENGDLEQLCSRAISKMEPTLDCVDALWSPKTGIVDSHGLMTALVSEAEDHGAILVKKTPITAIMASNSGGWNICGDRSGVPLVRAQNVINCAGLGAHILAHSTQGLSIEHIPVLSFAKGVYFSYSGRHPFRHLIYPVPEPGGLGVHLTLDLAGAARFGPDVEWTDEVNYSISPSKCSDFLQAARAIWPSINPQGLYPAYAGIRPKLSGPGQPAADFYISGPQQHGLSGLINLFGIESPGLTSCLAIARYVSRLTET